MATLSKLMLQPKYGPAAFRLPLCRDITQFGCRGPAQFVLDRGCSIVAGGPVSTTTPQQAQTF